MEYFAVMAHVLVFATGYIIAVERSTYHDKIKNNRRTSQNSAVIFYK